MNLTEKCSEIRDRMLVVGEHCGQAAHFGGSFSIVEILTTLYFRVMRLDVNDPCWAERDRFILSKGHAALALFATLAEVGYISHEKLLSFQMPGSDLIAHPIKNLNIGIEASTGSLGQGISFAVGQAEAIRRKGLKAHVFCLVGDGECNEGSVVEAIRLAIARKLGNLTVIVDRNGFQNDGKTDQIISNDCLPALFAALGASVKEVNGHDLDELGFVLESSLDQPKPTVLVANTVKGYGIEFMADSNDWHHNRITKKMVERVVT